MIQELIPPTAAPNPPVGPSRMRRDRWLRIGLVIAICLLLAVPVVVAMAARGQGPDRSLAVGASPAPTGSDRPERDDGDQGQKSGKHDKGLKADKSGPGKGPITIGAIDGSRITLKTDDGWTRTITATADTVITKGGQTITAGALKVGDEVRFRQVRNADGSYGITAIVVPTPVAGGEVTAVGARSITVKGKGGAARVITVTGSTVYKLGSETGSKADVKVGSEVRASGTVDGDTFTAMTVGIEPPHVDGTVTAKTSDTITIERGDGTTATIHVTGTTTYQIKNNHAATLADIAVGSRVSAEGRLRADGSLDVVAVHGKPAKALEPGKAPAASQTPG